MSEQARQSAAIVSLLLSSLLGALLAPAPAAHVPSTTSGFASAAKNPASTVRIAIPSQEADEDGSSTNEPPALAVSAGDLSSVPGRVGDLEPREPRVGRALSFGHGFSPRAPPTA